jgi:glycosyltransferase involved in cell wall biosynthesis
MRILVATDQWFPDRLGGVARLATDTARGWAARGHEVVVIAPEHEGAVDGANGGGPEVLRVLPRGRLPQTLSDPVATRRAASRLLRDPFDVLVAHGPTTARGLLSARSEEPLVYVFHADAAKEARFLRETLPVGTEWLAAVAFEGRLGRWTRSALESADAPIVLSEFSRGILAERAPEVAGRATLVPGFVDTAVFSPGDRAAARGALGVGPSTSLVLSVRRLEPRMGLENLVEAASLLDDVPGLRIVIGGSGSGLDLQGLRDRLGVGERVELIGRVSEADLHLWYRAADLFVLPTVAYEGFGLATAEALASGTPVVGTPVGATPELLRPLDPRLVASGTSPGELADAVRTALALATDELRARCREYALAHLSPEVALPAWEAVLERAVRVDGGTALRAAGR